MKKIWQIPESLNVTEDFNKIKDALIIYADALTEESDNQIIGIIENFIDVDVPCLSLKFILNVPSITYKYNLLQLKNCNKYPFSIYRKNSETRINSFDELITFMEDYVQSEESSNILSTYMYLCNNKVFQKESTLINYIKNIDED